MNEKYRLTIDGGTDNAFVKDYTKEELEAKKDYIDSNYKGRYKVDAIGDADTGSIDDNSSYTVKIDDSGFSKDYTGAELKGKMDYLNQNYSGRYRVETSLGSWDNMDSVFAPTPSAKDQLNTFRQENGAFLDDYEARDSAEAKQAARAGMTSGVYVPSEGSITADERQRYSDLRKQEEELKKAYYTSDDYLQSQLQAGEKLSEQRDLIYAEANQYAQEHPIVESGTAFIPNPAAGRSRGAEADKESQMYDTAKRIIDDTIKLHNAPSRYDKGGFWRNIGKFFKGAGEKASDIDLWTAGLSEITDNFKVRDVLESVQNKLGNLNDLSEDAIEGILSPAEKSVLKAWALNAQTQMARSEDLSRGYQAGQGAVESLGFMAEFALTGGIGKAASEGTEAFAKWLGKKALGTFKGMSDEVAEKTVKELGEKITGNVVGKYAANLANSLAEAAGRTGVMPSTFRNISEKATEIKTDENGNNYLVGMNEAFGKGLADSFIETLSEGGRVGALGELVGDVAGKIPSYARFVDHLSKSDMADLYKAFRSSGIMNTLRAGGWHGIGEEYLEEWYGNALRTLTGVDKDALKDYATVDNQIITVTSFLPMTIFGGSVSTAQVLSAKKGLDKKAAALQSALLERGYDEAQARNMIDMMRGATPSEMSDVLTPIVNKVAETSEKDAAILMRPIGDFALAVRKWQSFNTAYNYQEQEQRDNLFARMNENLGQFWQEKEDGTKVVETAVTDKGENVYLLAKPSADVYAQTIAEGEKVIPEAVPAITFDGRKMFVQQGSYKVLDELKMNDFLGSEIMSEKKNKEQARMIEEKEQKISQIKSIATTGSIVNIGTEEAPQQATVLQAKTDSAVLAMPDGSAREVTWEELGNYVGVNAKPQTDEQMDEQESETILAETEQREAELDQEYNNDADTIQELEEAEANIDAAVEAEESIPLKADGSVDQTALWNQSPEKWAKWNDEKRQDNGANSLNYITAALFKAQQDLAETAAAYDAELDFDTKESLEDEMATMQQRVERLASLQQTYMPKETEQVPQKTMLSAGMPAAEEAAPQRSIEAEVSRLYDLGLNDEEVQQNLDAKIAEAQKEISKQAKKAPKMGADAEAYVSKKREYEERMQKLQEEVDFWTGVKDEITNLKSQETQIPEAPVVEMEKDPEPMNAVEFAARELGLKEGGIKLRWDSFKHHTGYGNEERRKMFGLFKNKQDGGLTLEEAGERLMEMDRENNTGFFDQNDPNAGLDAILDVLGANSTIGELRTYTSRQRQSEAQRDADAAYSAMMAEYESTHGMTIEEAVAADAVQRGEIMQKALTKEQYNELNNIFAEEIYQNESRRTQTEAQGVYGAEARADESDVESGTDGAREESDQILPGEQAGISGTVEESELRHIEGRSNGDKSDGLPPVSSRESTAEVESDLDEDMPDFESMSDEEIAEIASDLFDHKQTKINTLRDRISWWEKHLGTKIDVYDNPNDVTNSEAKDLIESGKRVFGWFETESGTVALYLPSYALYPEATAMEMINRKIAHEIIAHKGLRGLLGEKQYNELCDRVFEQMTPETQTRFLSYASVNGDARKAADEFIAHLAENVELSEQERTIWDKIVDFIKNLFFARITTDDLSKLIRQSYTQLKANTANPAINSNANQQAEGNALFSLDDGSLIGMHNIPEEKLKKVIKQGGLANPSTAVIDISSQSFTSYGDISLVMPSSLVDAKSGRNAGTFTADAWTPVYPQVSKRFSNDKGQRRYWKDIAAIPEEMQGEARQGFDGWKEGRNSSGLAYMFLLERNEAPEMVRVQARFSDVLKNDLLAILGDDRDSLYKLSDEEKQTVLNLYIQQEFNGNREAFDESIATTIARIEDRLSTGKAPSFFKERITMDLQWMKEHGYNYENLSKFVNDVISDIRHAGEVNDAATTNLAIDYIRDNNLVQEFELWKESLDERYGIKEYLWGGYTPSGNQRWLPNTIENASKLMNQQGLAGAVGITASFNRFVATLAPKVKSLSDIKSSKDRLVEDDKLVDEFRDKWSEVFYDLGVKCQPGARGYEDYGLARLIEAAQKKNPGAYLKKEYNVELSKEDLQKLSEMISAIKNDFPARYFETKFQRPVYLNEFAAAVMPTTTSDDVKKAVSEAGLPIYEYDSDVKGARTEATRKAAAIEGVRFSYEDAMPQQNTMFSLSNENQAIFVSNAAKAVESIKMEKATPEQWLKMIEKNGGLKAGEDKWMGLSDWLKSSDKKTLSKEEVLNFINDNMIVIEEQHYSEIGADDLYEREVETQEALQGIFDEYIAESQDMNDDIFMRTHYDYAIQMLAETLGYQAWNAPFINNGATIELNYFDDIDDLNTLRNRLGLTNVKGEREINATRLDYTTEGLTDKHEIALTVPSIDSWNEEDDIHFGDAGEGRAVAWIRFGETEVTVQDDIQQRLNEIYDRLDELEMKVSSSTGITHEEYEERSKLRKERDELQEIKPKTQRVLVIDEIQSKRHQEGREKGYRVSNIEQWLKDNNVEVVESGEFYEFIKNGETDRRFSKGMMKYDIDKAKRLYVSGYNKSDIPAAPFEKNWHELAMKRMLRYAAENGYGAIAWTKGEQQAERYGLAHVVNDIYVSSSYIERYVSINTMSGDRIEVPTEPNSDVIVSGEYKGHRLSDVVGKELAEKILGIPEGVDDYISGDDLKVGGEGMKGFYDKMLPAFMNKYGKKWGVKVEDINLPNLESGLTMHSVPVTEEMKASVMEGQTMFSVVTPEQDAEYLAAVEAGDMETAQKMVNEAARRAMPNTKVKGVVYHGTRSAGNNRLDRGHFTDDYGFAEYYAGASAGMTDGGHVYKAFLNIENPLVYDFKGQNSDWALDENGERISTYAILERAKTGGYDGVVLENVDEYGDGIEEENGRYPGSVTDYIPVSPSQIKSADPVTYDDAGNVIPLSERFNPESSDIRFSVEESTNNGTSARYSAEERRVINELFPGAIQEETRFSAEEAASEDYTRFSVVTDPALIEELENGPKIKVYRAMQLIDGELYPPMSAKVEGKLREPIKLGQWEQAEERPDLIDSKGNFKLDKANKASVPARYNPYFHTSRTPLNDQFSSAQSRPNLVTVEVEIPESELTSGYKADKAKDSVGEKEWKAGVIQGKLSGTRKVILSRWDKPVRIVPDSEVAAEIVKMFDGKDITMPSNVVTPSLRAELEKLGVPFVETDNNGKPVAKKNSLLDVIKTLYTKGKDIANKLYQRSFFEVVETPAFMKEYGLTGNKFTVRYGVIARHFGKDGSHDLSEKDWEQLPSALQNPFAITKIKEEDKAFRIYTSLKTAQGEYVVVGVDVKNAGRDLEVNAISTVFGRRSNANLTQNEEVLYKSKDITPEQSSLLERPNSSQYPTEQELSDNKDSDNSENSNTLFSVDAETDEAVAEGISLSSAQMASLAGNIYADLPDSIRGKIIDDLKGDYLNLQNAIMQIPARLAMKEEWNEEDQIVADVIARQMTKAIDKKMSRPLTATEALWMLFDATHKDTDFISEASRAVVRRNLGFDQQTIQKEQQAKNDVRFSVASNASINATANLYNREVVNARTRLKESYVDMNASVEEFVKALEKSSGKKVQGFENILMALNQQSSKGLAAMESYERKFLNPMFAEILKIVKDNKKKYEDIVRYVILKHGLERNNIFAKRDAKEYYRAEYDKLVASINADDSLDDAKKKKAIDKAEKELDAHLADVDAEIDAKYAELKEKDYSGISSMFYDQLGVSRKDYDTEEAYQAALMGAKQNKYATLADVENAAEMEVQDFERKVKTDELWKSINAATKETLRQQYEANMISKDQYETLRDMFKYYVPLRGFKDNTAEDMYTYYRQPNSTGYTRPILGAEGRKTEAESPFGWIASMANSAIASNVKNEAKLALYYFVSNRPENGLATISKTWYMQTGVDADGKKIFSPTYPPFTESLSSEKAKSDYEAWQESMQALRKEGKAYEGRKKLNLGDSVIFIDSKDKPEHIVNVKVGGKDYSIMINGNPRAAQAINGDLNVETDPDYSIVFGRILRWMSSVNTSYNPEFWLTNMQRDMLFTLMAVSAKEDPAYRKRFAANYAKALKVAKLNAQNEKGTIGNSYLEKMYKEFVENGGVTGYTQIKGNEEWEKEIEKYLRSHDPEAQKMGRLMGATKDALHAFHRFGESLEQVSRFAAFLTSREMGKSMEESINDAKEITVNFNRKGSGKRITWEESGRLTNKKGQPLNDFERMLVSGLSWMAPIGRRFIMFFNAAIQGLNSMYKLYKNNPSKMAAWSMAYASVGAMNAILHSMMDDDDEYLDLPDYERRTSLLLGWNGVYFKWALPQEARAFFALGDLAVETILGRNPQGAGKVLGDALNIATDVLPVNPTEGWKAFVPSVAVPFVELLANEDYKSDPIYNEQKWLSKEEKKRTAKWSNAYSGTGTLYINIAKVLNNITGGDEFEAGLINIQPEKMQHIVQSAFGGTIRTADKFINLITAMIDSEEPVTVRQTPFLNRLLTIGDERFRNAYVNEVYDYYVGEAEHALTLQKKYQKARDKEAYGKLMLSEDMKIARIYDKYKKPIKKIQEQIKAAEGTSEKKELMQRQDELKKMMIKEISNL